MKRGDLITTSTKNTILWSEACTNPSGVIGSITHNDILLVLQTRPYEIEVLCNGSKGWIDLITKRKQFKNHTLSKLT
jgi:hypothetical protein